MTATAPSGGISPASSKQRTRAGASVISSRSFASAFWTSVPTSTPTGRRRASSWAMPRLPISRRASTCLPKCSIGRRRSSPSSVRSARTRSRASDGRVARPALAIYGRSIGTGMASTSPLATCSRGWVFDSRPRPRSLSCSKAPMASAAKATSRVPRVSTTA